VTRPQTPEEVERFNDTFAREHDINAYYADSGPLIRFIEERRLQIIERMANVRRGDRLLEVGCGGGHVLQRFPQAKITGVDVSGEMLNKAREKLTGLDFELLKGELQALELPEKSFDAIICTEVIEHVVEPEPILEEIARLAKPNARIVITFPNDNLINGIKGVIKKTGLTRVPPFHRMEWGGDHYHLHVWSIDEMRTFLGRHFRVKDEAFSVTRLFPIRCCFLCEPR
jgi:ubiquinone/menaquinone biosynthesis C-methylase UbiE